MPAKKKFFIPCTVSPFYVEGDKETEIETTVKDIKFSAFYPSTYAWKDHKGRAYFTKTVAEEVRKTCVS